VCDAPTILDRAHRAGLRLWSEGERINIAPARLCSSELLAQIRAAKPQLLILLEAKAANIPHDCTPWLHVARQVLAGEFEGADRSTVASLTYGLRRVPHPLCRQALARLQCAAENTKCSDKYGNEPQ